MNKEESLSVLVDSVSLSDVINTMEVPISILLSCTRIPPISIYATPIPKLISHRFSDEIFEMEIEHIKEKIYSANVFHGNSESKYGFYDKINSDMITHLYGYKECTKEFNKVKKSLTNILVCEALSRTNNTIFITENKNILEKQIWIQKRFDVKILTVLESLEYIDLYLKNSEIYYAKPFLKRTDGKAFHYWFLLKELVPEFSIAWNTIVFGEKRIKNGTQIKNSFMGLSDKFQNAFYASDKIGIEYCKQPINSTQWEMIYHLNYFCMIITGLFDSLSWLTVYYYAIPYDANRLFDITIKITGKKRDKFVRQIGVNNPSLEEFIRKNQKFIKLFTPLRNSAIHREPTRSSGFEKGDEGWSVCAAIIDKESHDSIVEIDKLNEPISDWGLLVLSPGYAEKFLEPYHFSRKALKEMINFVNTYLQLLDFSDLKNKNKVLVKIPKKAPEPPFLPSCYWKHESYLPILHRSRIMY